MSAGHTPGPWVATGIGGPWEQRLSIRAAGWGCVAHVGVNPSLPHWDLPQRSNARLIAAAPELLEACQAAWNCIAELSPTQARVEVAQLLQAAIEKAEGAET